MSAPISTQGVVEAGARRVQPDPRHQRSPTPRPAAPPPPERRPSSGRAARRSSAAASSGWPRSVMTRPSGVVLGRDLAPKPAEHPLGVVAGRLLLDHHRLAGRVQPGEQHRRLHLRRGHRRRVLHRHRVRRAGQRDRQPPAAPPARLGAEERQRLGDPPHRPAAQAGVAGEGRGDVGRRHRPHDQPHAGAGVAVVDHVLGLLEAADADALRPASRPGPARSTVGAEGRIARPVSSTSWPSSRPVIRVSPTASAPRISARCEIDLSPGTSALPAQRPRRLGPHRFRLAMPRHRRSPPFPPSYGSPRGPSSYGESAGEAGRGPCGRDARARRSPPQTRTKVR